MHRDAGWVYSHSCLSAVKRRQRDLLIHLPTIVSKVTLSSFNQHCGEAIRTDVRATSKKKLVSRLRHSSNLSALTSHRRFFDLKLHFNKYVQHECHSESSIIVYKFIVE